MPLPVRSIRLDPKSSSYLDKLSGQRGEIFFDNDADTLRVYSGEGQTGVALLKADFSNVAEGNNIDFNGKTITADIIGTVSSLSNHSINALGDVDASSATSGQVLYYDGVNWSATTLSSTFNGGNVGGVTSFLSTTQATSTTTGAVKISGGLGVVKNAYIGGNAVVTGSLSTASTLSATGNFSVNATKFTVNATTGDIVAAGTATFTGTTETAGELRIKGANALKLYDSNNSNFIAFKSSTNVVSDVTFILPPGDGDPGQVLSTDGSGNLSWVTQSSGGSGGGSYVPAGSTGQIQYNATGVLGADVDFTFTTATNTLAVPNITATNVTAKLTGNVVGDVYASNGVGRILESGTDGTDAIFSGTVNGTLNGNVAGNINGNVTTTALQATGGNIDNIPVGATTRSTGAFTTLTSNGVTTVTNTTDSSSPTTGAMKVSGGLGVTLNTNVGGSFTATGDITTASNLIVGGVIQIENAPVQTTDATNKQYVDTRSIAMSVALS